MKVTFTRKSLQDLRDLRSYLEERDPKAATEYGERFETAFDMLAKFPRSGPKGEKPGTREYRPIAPYVIIYKIDAEDDDRGAGGQLTVLNVWRGERDRSRRS